jgi:hypothetical protein
MIRVLQSLLALIALLLLAWMAPRADGAPWQEANPVSQCVPTEEVVSVPLRVAPVQRCLAPRPQPGTRLQGQPFAYGYFGARAQPTAAYHRSDRGDWFQWSFRRAD